MMTKSGIQDVENFFDNVGKVEGKVEEGVGGAAEAFFGDFLAGVGGGGEEDDFVRMFGAELSGE